MTDRPTDTRTVQVHQVTIKAAPDLVWRAITEPEWTERYGYGGRSTFDLRPGGDFVSRANEGMLTHGAPEVVADGEVLEADPPRRLVQTWRLLMDPGMAAEGFTRITYELVPTDEGTVLTVTHDLTGAPSTARMVGGQSDQPGAGGGWRWVLDELKALLEREPDGGRSTGSQQT